MRFNLKIFISTLLYIFHISSKNPWYQEYYQAEESKGCIILVDLFCPFLLFFESFCAAIYANVRRLFAPLFLLFGHERLFNSILCAHSSPTSVCNQEFADMLCFMQTWTSIDILELAPRILNLSPLSFHWYGTRIYQSSSRRRSMLWIFIQTTFCLWLILV